jgi:predicted DNA-binding antitoxin AbrB/MazE fold protein
MTQHVNAIYENGVLKPLEPLDLKDQELVSLSIDKLEENRHGIGDEGPTLFELFDEVGLVGCVQDEPRDLSTNPKHMEGFGKSGN